MDKFSAKKSATDEMPVLTLRDVVSPLFRKKRVVLASFLAISSVATLVAWGWANRYYVSTMQVVVGRERTEPTVSPQPSAALQDTNKFVTTDDVAS